MADRDNQIHKNIEEQKYWDRLEVWKDDGDEWSETFGGTDKLWNDVIYPKISSYLKGDILEIAPGYGRMSDKLLDYSSKLYLVDMNKKCIDRCRERFKDKDNISYFVNDGLSLEAIDDNSIDFVFSWDSFVHMQKFVIENYLAEISKKLKQGEVGAIHHSYLMGGDDEFSFQNKQGRSNFTPELFKLMCSKYNLEIIEQEVFQFNEIYDVFSIFKK